MGLSYRRFARSRRVLVAAWYMGHMVGGGRPSNLLAGSGQPVQLLYASARGQSSTGEPFLNMRRNIDPLSND